jgi:hypothetical protein
MKEALTCPVTGCEGVRKNSSMLMCWPCWRRVPKLLKNAVWDAFHAYERDPTVSTVRNMRDEQQRAIAAVEAKHAELRR